MINKFNENKNPYIYEKNKLCIYTEYLPYTVCNISEFGLLFSFFFFMSIFCIESKGNS